MTDIQALYDALKRASTALDVLNKEKREAITAATNRINDKFAARIAEARAAVGAAKITLDQANEAEAASNPLVGRKAHRAHIRGRFGASDVIERNGVVEAFKRGDAYPGTVYPEPGTLVIRHLKKDGTRGMVAERFDYKGGLPSFWKLVEDAK